MAEKLYMIPINDAVAADDECPLCNLVRNIEHDLLDFALGSGSSYMQSDTRDQTDRYGFCRRHFKQMYEYGNTLGNGWILKTHLRHAIENFDHEAKKGAGIKMKKKGAGTLPPAASWARAQAESCLICNYFDEHYERYLDTFIEMYQKDEEFARKINTGKGLCLPHFADIIEAASARMKPDAFDAFYTKMCDQMHGELTRQYEDISWLIEKFDYRNNDAPWKNSKDAVQRAMQKLSGGYPADGPYTGSK